MELIFYEFIASIYFGNANIWLWTAVNRVTKKLVGFFVGDRSSESFEKLCENISHIDAKFYATDKFSVYDIIPNNKHLIGKSNTYMC